MLKTERELAFAALSIRKNLLKLSSRETIHIGGDLSIADVMTVLWQYQMRYDPKNPKDENRDRFILSKGHASAVMAFNQAAIGCFSAEDVIREYAKDDGRFSMHSCNLINPFVEISTGSLGHGMPIACGIAAALRLKRNNSSRVYTVMGDGEQEEGSVWEAVMNAVHYELGNLILLIDNNNLSADGAIHDISGLGDIAEKYRAYSWNVREINGNDIVQIKKEFDNLPSPISNKPTVLVCHTVKGKGVSYMENDPRWHAGKITQELYNRAVSELEQAFVEQWGA